MNWCAIDPGDPTGLSIFDWHGRIIHPGTLNYVSSLVYNQKLDLIRMKHNIQFAIIEEFVFFPRMVRYHAFNVHVQVQICKEVFRQHILINPSQWNPRKYKDRFKREIAAQTFNRTFVNSHETDSALIGNFIWNQVNVVLEKPFDALLWLSRTKRKWPTRMEKSLYHLWTEYQEIEHEILQR